jgi:hypothetical protein
VSAADYDNDGFVDFYVSNFKDAFCIGTIDNVHGDGARRGVPGPGHGFAMPFDYDNDGWADLFATSYFIGR